MKITYLTITLTLILSSCTKTDLVKVVHYDKKDIIDLYLDLTNPELDASISFTNYQANFGRTPEEDEVNYMTMSCLKNRAICDYENIHINQQKFKFREGRFRLEDEYDFRSLFGQNLNITLSNDDLEKDDPITIDIYLPNLLQVTLEDDAFLGNGYTISWNADLLNEEGVYIVVMYTPLENGNLSEFHPEKQTNYITVEDNGSYTFSPSDFPDIPEGSIITLKVLRGAYVIAETASDTEELLRIFGVTHSTGYIKFN